jgi:hypothetical protein
MEDEFENWDDDDFLIDGDDNLRRVSSSTNAPSHRRDSHSSHFSVRSEIDSVFGEEERQVHIPDDDEKSTLDAIAAAAKIGIQLPKNVPPSALMGGTIKRLGGRKIKKIIQDDWEQDLELPESGQGLQIKPQDSTKFPEVLRQVSGGSVQASPTKSNRLPPTIIQDDRRGSGPKQSVLGAAINLDRFRDTEEDDDFFGDGSATIKVSKSRGPKAIQLITPPTPQKTEKSSANALDDDFENDFELPSDGKLKLSTKKDIPRTPLSQNEDLDWGEGSLGTRYGGTRRDGRSNRSSSASALSPSVSSSITAESEDDTFDGLLLPTGHVNFQERLKKRKDSRSPERILEEPPIKTPQLEPDQEDLLSGLDLGDGEVFNSSKLTLHRNIQVKETRTTSPSRPKTSASITFTHKPLTVNTQSRLPRPSHERAQSSLEPVSESGGPILQRTRRSQSRLGHSAQSSVSSIHTPTTPSSVQSVQSLPPSTPRRRELGAKTSATSLRNEPTTTSSQLLRFKRSLPVMKAPQSPAKSTTSRYDRPPSRTDSNRSQASTLRPKTPVDRTRSTGDTAASLARRNPMPFIPAGASASTSHHVTTKSSRVFRRHDSDNSIDLRPNSRAVSRSTMRSPSPRRRNPEKIAHDTTWPKLYKPNRTRHFGDGHELDGFDDLPTSIQAESKYMVKPTSGTTKMPLRNKIYQNILPDRTATPSPSTPYSPAKLDFTPHFARDTATSRIAREASLAQRAPSAGPLAPLTMQRVAQLSTRSNLNPSLPQTTVRSKKNARKPPQQKPHLIANLNSARESKR